MPPLVAVSPPCENTVPWLPVADRFAQADTVKLPAVFSTGALVVTWLVLDVLKVAAPPDQVTLLVVPVFPLPEVSCATVPPSAFSGQTATGRPDEGPYVVVDVTSPWAS